MLGETADEFSVLEEEGPSVDTELAKKILSFDIDHWGIPQSISP